MILNYFTGGNSSKKFFFINKNMFNIIFSLKSNLYYFWDNAKFGPGPEPDNNSPSKSPSACKLCTISVPTVCKNTVFYTSRVDFIAKTASLLYKYHKISFCALPRLECVNFVQNVYKLVLYKCTQVKFTVQVYTKLCANWLSLV